MLATELDTLELLRVEDESKLELLRVELDTLELDRVDDEREFELLLKTEELLRLLVFVDAVEELTGVEEDRELGPVETETELLLTIEVVVLLVVPEIEEDEMLDRLLEDRDEDDPIEEDNTGTDEVEDKLLELRIEIVEVDTIEEDPDTDEVDVKMPVIVLLDEPEEYGLLEELRIVEELPNV